MALRTLGFFIVTLFVFFSCDSDSGEVTPTAPRNLQIQADVSSDGSGFVSFTATADNAIVYYFFFGEDANETRTASSNGQSNYTYGKSGTNTFTVRVQAAANGGETIEEDININVTVSFEPPSNITNALTGGSSKFWYWKQSAEGHLGLGSETSSTPNTWSAAIDEKVTVGCLYDDVMTFIDNGDGTFSYTQDNDGATYFQSDAFAGATGQAATGNDECADYSTVGKKGVIFRPLTSSSALSTGISMTIAGNGFLSYFINTNEYEIVSISDTELKVRALENFNGTVRAWYHIFTNVSEQGEPTFTGNSGSGNNDVLVWADEFDVDGAPNNGNWTYDIGTGDNGWGNTESQNYTRRPENVIIENGILKIHLINETYQGSDYTSARILTQGLVDFKYGKVEARAKLPTGIGTWPAIWMLGSNINSVGWPACGEIDIMEHVGQYQDRLYSTLHYPGNSGGNGVGKHMMVANLSTQFHTYTLDWSVSKIEFAVDGNVWHTINNDSGIPFNQEFFIIMNVAIGGNFGGSIDGNFDRSSMEVDYIRVYQ